VAHSEPKGSEDSPHRRVCAFLSCQTSSVIAAIIIWLVLQAGSIVAGTLNCFVAITQDE
jgi:hypothetical protein